LELYPHGYRNPNLHIHQFLHAHEYRCGYKYLHLHCDLYGYIHLYGDQHLHSNGHGGPCYGDSYLRDIVDAGMRKSIHTHVHGDQHFHVYAHMQSFLDARLLESMIHDRVQYLMG
jgi:hypothetical protein